MFPSAWQGVGGSDGLLPRAAAAAWRSMPSFTRYLSGASVADVTFSRGSKGWSADAPLVELADNVPRFDTAGMLVAEGQRTNGLRNSRGEGTNGTISGSNVGVSAVPSFWNAVAQNIGGTLTFQQVTDGGRPCVDIVFTNYEVSADDLRIFLEANTQVPAAVNQTWALTVSAKIVSGAMPAVQGGTPNLMIIRESSSGGGNTGLSGGPFQPVAGAFTRMTAIRKLAGATTAFVSACLFNGSMVVGQTINLRLRVFIENLEQATFPSTPIVQPVGVLAAQTRAADLASIAAPAGVNGFAGRFMVPALPQAGADPLVLAQLDGGSDGNRTVFWVEPSGALNAFVVGSSFDYLGTLMNVAPGVPFSFAANMSDGATRAKAAGGSQQTLVAAPSARTIARLGNRADGFQSGFCRIGPVDLYPVAPPLDMALAALPQ